MHVSLHNCLFVLGADILIGLVEDMVVIDQSSTELLQLLAKRTEIVVGEVIVDGAELLHQHFYMWIVGRDDSMIVVAHFAELLHIFECLPGIVKGLGVHLPLRI